MRLTPTIKRASAIAVVLSLLAPAAASAEVLDSAPTQAVQQQDPGLEPGPQPGSSESPSPTPTPTAEPTAAPAPSAEPTASPDTVETSTGPLLTATSTVTGPAPYVISASPDGHTYEFAWASPYSGSDAGMSFLTELVDTASGQVLSEQPVSVQYGATGLIQSSVTVPSASASYSVRVHTLDPDGNEVAVTEPMAFHSVSSDAYASALSGSTLGITSGLVSADSLLWNFTPLPTPEGLAPISEYWAYVNEDSTGQPIESGYVNTTQPWFRAMDLKVNHGYTLTLIPQISTGGQNPLLVPLDSLSQSLRLTTKDVSSGQLSVSVSAPDPLKTYSVEALITTDTALSGLQLNWGDGTYYSFDSGTLPAGSRITLKHSYRLAQDYTIQAVGTDTDGLTSQTVEAVAVVTNNPLVDGLTAALSIAQPGEDTGLNVSWNTAGLEPGESLTVDVAGMSPEPTRYCNDCLASIAVDGTDSAGLYMESSVLEGSTRRLVLRADQRIAAGSRISFSLTLTAPAEGAYLVDVVEPMGAGSTEYVVYPQDLTLRPSAPTNLELLRLSGGQVEVSWDPSPTLNAPVARYVVRVSPENGYDICAQSTNGTTVKCYGLVAETSYKVTVTAVNSNGSSTPLTGAFLPYSWGPRLGGVANPPLLEDGSVTAAFNSVPGRSYEARAQRVDLATHEVAYFPGSIRCTDSTCTATWSNIDSHIDGRPWAFLVRAADGAGGVSNWSAWVPDMPDSALDNVTVTRAGGKVTFQDTTVSTWAAGGIYALRIDDVLYRDGRAILPDGGTYRFAYVGLGGTSATTVLALSPVSAPAPEITAAVPTAQVGPAPLDTSVQLTTTAIDGTPLEYSVNWGDTTGIETGTWAPGQLLHHTYPSEGQYTASFTLTDTNTGLSGAAKTLDFTSYTPEELHADAGTDTTAFIGDAVRFNAANSRPWAGVKSVHWTFGDGASSSAADTTHTYANPGTYTATLTITSYAGQTSEATRTIAIKDPDATPGLHVRVTSAGSSLSGANISLTLADGTTATAVTGAGGKAILPVPSDGQYAVHVQATGYILATGVATVTDGTGKVVIDLRKGSSAPSVLSIATITADDAKALGVNLDAASNQQIFKADIVVTFAGITRTVTIVGTPDKPATCVANCTALTWNGTTGGSGATEAPVGQPTIVLVGDQPMIQWVKVSATGSFLKEMFTVDMTLQNATSDYTFTPGTATLHLPAGMSLAELADGSSNLTHDVPAIAAGGSVTTSWVVRGDTAGSYTLNADYTSTTDPAEFPVISRAQSAPVKIWGLEGVSLTASADQIITPGSPYDIVLTLKNGSPRTLYNVTLDGHEGALESQGGTWIYSPTAAEDVSAAQLSPGSSLTRTVTIYPLSTAAGMTLPTMQALGAHVSGSNIDATVSVHQNRQRDTASEMIAAKAEAGSMRLSWLVPNQYSPMSGYTPGVSVTGYDVAVAHDLDGQWTSAGHADTATFLLDPSANPQARYATVTTVLSDGRRVNQHGFTSLTLPPAAPQGVSVSTDGLTNAVKVSWDQAPASDSVSGHTIITNAPDGASQPAATQAFATATSVTITGLDAGRKYTFDVIATNPVGSSHASTSKPIVVNGVNGPTPEWWRRDYRYTQGGGVSGNTTPKTALPKILGTKVNTLTGELYAPAGSPFPGTDVSSAGWAKSYSSAQAGQNSPLGWGWTNKYFTHLTAGTFTETGAEQVRLDLKNGAQVQFFKNPQTGEWVSAPFLSTLTLSQDSSGWTFHYGTAETYRFDSAGQLLSVQAGTAVYTLTYDANGQLSTIKQGTALRLSLTWEGAHIVKAAYATTSALYSYDTNGNLASATTGISATAPAGVTYTFRYDTAHRMTSYTVPATATAAEYTMNFAYDASGRVESQTKAGTTDIGFAYASAEGNSVSTLVSTGTGPTVTSYSYVDGLFTQSEAVSGNKVLNTSVTPGGKANTYIVAWDQLSKPADQFVLYAYTVAGTTAATKLASWTIAPAHVSYDSHSGLWHADSGELKVSTSKIQDVDFSIRAVVSGKQVAMATSTADKAALRSTVYPNRDVYLSVPAPGERASGLQLPCPSIPAGSSKDGIVVVLGVRDGSEDFSVMGGMGWRAGTLGQSLQDSLPNKYVYLLSPSEYDPSPVPEASVSAGASITDFTISTVRGIRAIQDEMRRVAAYCPSAQIVLAGYGQGAVVAKKAFQNTPNSFLDARSKTRVVMLESDPTRSESGVSTFDPKTGTVDGTYGSALLSGTMGGDSLVMTLQGASLVSLAAGAVADAGYNIPNPFKPTQMEDYERSKFLQSCIDGDSSCDPFSLRNEVPGSMLHTSSAYLAKPGDQTTTAVLGKLSAGASPAETAAYQQQESFSKPLQKRLETEQWVDLAASLYANNTVRFGTSVYAGTAEGNALLKEQLTKEAENAAFCGVGAAQEEVLKKWKSGDETSVSSFLDKVQETAKEAVASDQAKYDGVGIEVWKSALEVIPENKDAISRAEAALAAATTPESYQAARKAVQAALFEVGGLAKTLSGAGASLDGLDLILQINNGEACGVGLTMIQMMAGLSTGPVGAVAIVSYKLAMMALDKANAARLEDAMKAVTNKQCFWTAADAEWGTLGNGQWKSSTHTNDWTDAGQMATVVCPAAETP